MTKYILHGGNTSENHSDNDAFFKEIADSVPENGTLLLNYFSRIKGDAERCYKQDTKKILKVSKRKDIKFEVADAKILKNQLVKCDGMYMRGGGTPELKRKLNKTNNLEILFKGKTISGSSAGAYVLVKYYNGNTLNKNSEGLGMLKMKLRCHYSKKDDNKVIPSLLSYKEKNMPVITLGDHEWVIIFK